jgi:hypothetical protein
MKPVYTTLVLAVLVSISSLYSQSIWSVVKGNEGAKFASDIQQTSDRGYIISGFSGIDNSGSYYVLKLDEFGITQWENTINLTNWQERSFSIAEAPDGGYVIFGNGNNGKRPYVVKLDSNGNIGWVSPWSDQQPFNRALQAFGTVLDNGSIVLISNSNENKSYLYQVDSSGSLDNVLAIPDVVPAGFTNGTFVTGVTTTQDGGFILTGTTSPTASGNAFLYKFDETGTIEWLEIYTWPASAMRYPNSVTQTADGGYLLTGANAPNSESTTVLRTNSTGQLSWAQVYVDTVSGYNTEGKDIIELSNGQLVVVENKLSAAGSQTYSTDILLLDSTGTLISRTPYTAGEYSTALSRIYAAIDGGYVMAGFLRNEININALELLVVKADANGQLPECTFACVWPGDLNNDGIVDMNDFMTLGLAFNMEGPNRQNAVNDWIPQSALAWNFTLSNGTNAKYADADGNGIVAIADTAGIVLNYSFLHPINNKPVTGDEPPLYFNVDEMEMMGDDIVLLPLYAGHADLPVIDFYGMFFQLQFDPQWILPGSLKLHDGSALSGSDGVSPASLLIEYPDEYLADIGFTRINHENATGFGHIATLQFRLSQPFTTLPEEGIDLEFAINFAQGHSLNLDAIQFTAGQNTVHIAQVITNLEYPIASETQVEIFPNPYQGGKLNLKTTQPVVEIKLYNVHGSLLRTVHGKPYADFSDLGSGVYIIAIQLEDGSLTHQKLKVE